HDGRQAHGADADDEDGVAEARTGFVEDGTGAGAEAAGVRPQQFERDVGADLHERVGRDDRVRRERRLTEEVAVDRVAVARVRGGALQFALEAAARDERLARAQAVAGLAVEAVSTLAAGGPADDD